jgi:EPS-associated MarR family transcriptional regulator
MQIFLCIAPNWVNPWLKSFKSKTIARYRPTCHTSIWAITGCGSYSEFTYFQIPELPDRIYPMTTRRQTANDDTLFWTLKVLQENPGVSQRTLAKEVGINVSTINFCLKALVEKGWIKMGNFSKNPDKLSYAYLLTPTGVAEKAVLTRRFLHRKMAEYEKLRGEIEALQLEAEQATSSLANESGSTK